MKMKCPCAKGSRAIQPRAQGSEATETEVARGLRPRLTAATVPGGDSAVARRVPGPDPVSGQKITEGRALGRLLSHSHGSLVPQWRARGQA